MPSVSHPAGDGPARPTLATLVYCVRDQQVLLLERVKEPFPGRWVAPGGKVEHGESPVECAARELREETGLSARRLLLRGVITETSPRPDWQWLIFAYVVPEFDGELIAEHREGRLRWWSLPEWNRIPMPGADRQFFAPVLWNQGPPYEATFRYDAALTLLGQGPAAPGS